MRNGIDRVEDGWDVRSIRGVGVGEVVVGSVMRLHIGSHGIEVHSPAELTAGGEAYAIHAAGRINLDKVTLLLDQVVAEVHVSDSGALKVRFAGGWRLDVPVVPEGLGWIVALRGRHFISPVAGGGVRMSDRRSG
ncbi:DUF6188 family protein [Streptomyces sp. NPDC021225]|uniref:DUF6188 family protein n=1 Tax=Streptomyces sp. NPDC021225 TaxID=3365121 RepID=UPI0037995F48